MSNHESNKAITKAINLDQKIRRLARREGFVATKSRRDAKWYFADQQVARKRPRR